MRLLATCVGVLLARIAHGLSAVDDSNDLKILHWVHVPKAGGTAITSLLKKVVCQINPSIRETNPCCRKQLCLHSNACHAAVGGCPLVTAIGRHATNMAVATSVPCCSSDLAMGITASFTYFALPSADIFLKDEYAHASLSVWPLVDRVAFLLSTGNKFANQFCITCAHILYSFHRLIRLLTGISRETIYNQIEQKKYSAQVMDGKSISSLVSAADFRATSSFKSDMKSRNRRLAECSMLARIKDDKDVGRSEALPEGKMWRMMNFISVVFDSHRVIAANDTCFFGAIF